MFKYYFFILLIFLTLSFLFKNDYLKFLENKFSLNIKSNIKKIFFPYNYKHLNEIIVFKDLEIQKRRKIHDKTKIRNLIKNEIKTISLERDLSTKEMLKLN